MKDRLKRKVSFGPGRLPRNLKINEDEGLQLQYCGYEATGSSTSMVQYLVLVRLYKHIVFESASTVAESFIHSSFVAVPQTVSPG